MQTVFAIPIFSMSIFYWIWPYQLKEPSGMWCLMSDNTRRHHVQSTSWISLLIAQIWRWLSAKEVADIIQDSCLRDIIWHSEKCRFVFWMLWFLHKNSKSLLTSLKDVSWSTVSEQNRTFKAVLYFVFSRSSKWSKIKTKRACHPLSFSLMKSSPS